MIEEIINGIEKVGFPIVITLILVYDKIKTNKSLTRVVENNNEILIDIKNYLMKGGIGNGRR